MSAPAMTYAQYRMLRLWVQALTAQADWPWTLIECKGTDAPLRVIVDTLASVRKGRGLRADTILEIPWTVTVDDFKRRVIERLAQGSDPCPSL